MGGPVEYSFNCLYLVSGGVMPPGGDPDLPKGGLCAVTGNERVILLE
jgi:hypothetical protein